MMHEPLPPAPDLRGHTLDFEIEHIDELGVAAETRHWWAGLRHDGFYAIGGGHSPWEAIASCLDDIPRALAFTQTMERVHRDNVEGRCPRCQQPREPMPDPLPDGGWPAICDACRARFEEQP